jgi:predicted nucleotide-binding protein (sugar kinase/HSP70/actin superfamily)
LVTIGCGKIYDCSYDRYGWYPHVKYKITGADDMINYLFPFLDKYQLQAKKCEVYKLFKEIVLMYRKKEHLIDKGYQKIVKLRNKMRSMGKKHNSMETARIRENRSSSGVGR